jgi:hypothetical protein
MKHKDRELMGIGREEWIVLDRHCRLKVSLLKLLSHMHGPIASAVPDAIRDKEDITWPDAPKQLTKGRKHPHTTPPESVPLEDIPGFA